MSNSHPMSAAGEHAAVREMLAGGLVEVAGGGLVSAAPVNTEPGPPLTRATLLEAIDRLSAARRGARPPTRYVLVHRGSLAAEDIVGLLEWVGGAYRPMGGLDGEG